MLTCLGVFVGKYIFTVMLKVLVRTYNKRKLNFFSLTRLAHSETIIMPRTRHFENINLDYTESNFDIPSDHLEFWKEKILDFVTVITKYQHPNDTAVDGGLYVGISGIAYMFYYLGVCKSFSGSKNNCLENALKYIKPAIQYADRHKKDSSDKAAFLLGHSGTHAVACVIYAELGDKEKADFHLKKFIESAAICKPVDFLRCGGDELFVGRTGFLAGAAWLNKQFKKEVVPLEAVIDICNVVVESGREYSKKYKSPSPLMYSYYNVEYLGAAHGLCSILQMLLSFPSFLHSNPSAERDIKQSVDFLLSLQMDDGNFPCDMEEINVHRNSENELVHWCHGAPGVVYLMAKAYLIWRAEKYLLSCLKCGELVWRKGLLRKGPGTCHGVSGNGYVFLLLYRLTNDKKHLYRATQFAKFLYSDEFTSGARTPDNPYSLYEGLAGTVCFIVDLLQPETAAFPFHDVFE